uniref:BHLH domain-containing protein n=1 Tax=Hordeum vulgare subsp. vulgare TaxID=112509 RepID=A0A8I6YPG5_HORVV
MAGARRSEQSLAVAGSTRAPGRPQRRRPRCPLYAELAALLPGDLSRANQVDILDAAVAHLKVLADTAAVLEAYRALQRDAGPVRPATVEVASREAVCITVRLPPPVAARPGALTALLEVFDRRGVEVLAVTVTRDRGAPAADVMVTMAAAATEVVQLIKAEIAGMKKACPIRNRATEARRDKIALLGAD